MFKAILPSSKKAQSSEPPPRQSIDLGKENRPELVPLPRSVPKPWVDLASRRDGTVVSLKPKEKDMRLAEAGATNRAFEKMLDDMQIPSTLRPKLITLDSPVKAMMLKSSHTLGLMVGVDGSEPPKPPGTPSLRRARSSETLSMTPPKLGHGHSPSVDGSFPIPRPNFLQRPLSGSFIGEAPGPALDSKNSTASSATGVQLLGQLDSLPPAKSGADANKGKITKGKGVKDKEKADKDQSPEAMCAWLSLTKSSVLDLERVKRLRLLLRNEAASWSEAFLRAGGYSGLVNRLTEILDMEWREEQHDDKALHEILRCFKALSTSSIGCFALRSSCPTPFAQLVALLYSDKKPGDIGTRQLIVEQLLILFELFPSTATLAKPKNNWEQKGSGHVIPPARPTVFTRPASSNSPPPPLPAPHTSIFSLIRALLLTPRPAPSESPSNPISPHAFITQLHLPRIYKVYLKEVADTCRDYFWAFCHPNNTIWDLDKTDEEKVEKPRAPDAITGGVEFEAMAYLTTHFRLINTLARAAADLNLPASDEQSAYKFHSDLFVSGFEPIILTARKSSTTYYPTLHLEIARYVLLASQARFDLPYSILRLVGPPPAVLYRRVPASNVQPYMVPPRPGSPVPPVSPSKRALGSPILPPPRRMEEIKF